MLSAEPPYSVVGGRVLPLDSGNCFMHLCSCFLRDSLVPPVNALLFHRRYFALNTKNLICIPKVNREWSHSADLFGGYPGNRRYLWGAMAQAAHRRGAVPSAYNGAAGEALRTQRYSPCPASVHPSILSRPNPTRPSVVVRNPGTHPSAGRG